MLFRVDVLEVADCMTLKSITVEFHEPWGQGFKTFNGWVYYMVSGNDYLFYEISPTEKNHKLLGIINRYRVKNIRERILL